MELRQETQPTNSPLQGWKLRCHEGYKEAMGMEIMGWSITATRFMVLDSCGLSGY
ncbi:hypothetical protein SESBI_33767 [Sesbania bispinosa]|nr:hypothetical protein SESBI_33767 [Sesbania bispinosa]